MSRAGQRKLAFRTWGGKRVARHANVRPGRVRHRARPEHAKRHPVHVTLRAERRLPSLRKQLVFLEIRRAFTKTSRSWFRIIHFSVQSDHVHLLVEAADKIALSRGIVGALVRVARTVNRVLGRRGKLWNDRYHARALQTPREVRHGLVYVLMNFRKHVPHARGYDGCSSAWFFDGWRLPPASGPPRFTTGDVPVRAPQSWLARVGWKRYGLIGPNERPSLTSR
jgi:putative transposase